MDRAVGFLAEFSFGRQQDLMAATADVDGRAQFKESLGGSLTESGTSPGNEDAFVLKKIVLEHDRSPVYVHRDCNGEVAVNEAGDLAHVTGNTKAVVRVLKLGWDAGTGRAT